MDVICTSFDSKQKLLQKYPETKDILPRIPFKKLHEINAWELEHHFPEMKFDRILWNHPHLGTEDFKLHRFLLSHFFYSVSKVLKQDGMILLSLVKGQETRWNLREIALKAGFHLCRIQEFHETDWPGYIVKRNKCGKSFKNIKTLKHTQSKMKSFMYHFSMQQPKAPILTNRLNQQQEEQENLPLEKDKWTCPHCSKVLTSDRAFKQHVHMVHVLKQFGENWKPNQEKTIECLECSKLFVNEKDKWQHDVNKHYKSLMNQEKEESIDALEKDEWEYIACEICGQAIVNEAWGKQAHLDQLKPLIGSDLKCDLCLGLFLESRAFQQHFKYCQLKQQKRHDF